MTKLSFAAAFAVGLAVLAWIGFGFIGSSFVPLAVSAISGLLDRSPKTPAGRAP